MSASELVETMSAIEICGNPTYSYHKCAEVWMPGMFHVLPLRETWSSPHHCDFWGEWEPAYEGHP